MSLAHWTDPRVAAEAQTWMRKAASAHGRGLTGAIERSHVRPWSVIYRAPTATSAVYLKVCHRVQAHEPALTELLAGEFPSLVPELIARHPTEPWMLLGDGGVKLREALAGQPLLDMWVGLLPRYAELQRRLAGREADLRALGVPDRRLEHLAQLLRPILDDDGSAPADVRARARVLLPTIDGSCAELATCGIGPSLDHSDLHYNNVLVRDGRPAIFDWGDAGVTHPFLSLTVTLEFAATATGLTVDAPAIRRLREAYLEPWTALATRRTLERAADTGLALGTIPGVLTWYRIATEIDGVLAQSPGEMAAMLGRVCAAVERLRAS
ncbi:MAG TPA: phosphotransferase [Candidatus Limnocylindria bacterium]|nr:phosphotransferase [Candidatus Limnocylindria bacterium]